MTIFRTLTATAAAAAATLVVLSLSSCSSKEGTPVAAPESRPDMTMSTTTSSPVDTVRPGTRIAIGDGDERVICTLGFILTDNVKWFGTTASYCVNKGTLPAYVQNTSGEMVKIGVAQSNYNGAYDRHDSNVGLVEIDRAALKKEGINVSGAITGTPVMNPLGTQSPEDFYTQAKVAMDSGKTVKVCWWTNNSVQRAIQRCGVPKAAKGDKLLVTPDEGVEPYESSAAGAPAAFVFGYSTDPVFGDNANPLGTVTDYNNGVIVIDSILGQTEIKTNSGGTWRIVGN
jgi:hypothetical protein